ncbi:hypothetical protein SAMN05444008_102362 [Cnuella takakiae]|uniref:Uncharacterized protein n=1 Tax=Cnuella takakiae TaxID=1302690 RepID=A0A1M4VS50_9BACT|nr:hypothetical protein [Cnuella takakiae]OLY92516.1 hypothetical protein BUE76_11910 [Cnuella takakiae]SHE71789.1 hypothetical protein SAMN05444008_102362 [Cnuella takakiae]
MKRLKILLLFLLAYAGAYAQKAQRIPTWYEYDYNQFSKGLAIPSGSWQIPVEYQNRVHLKGSASDSTLEVWVPTLGRWAKVGGGFNKSDTSTALGVPFVAPGQWVQQQIAALPSQQEPYYVNGELAGIDFKDANGNVYFRWLFDTGDEQAAVEYLRRVNAGYGLTPVNDSTPRVDTFAIATRGRLYKTLDSLKATIPQGNTYTAGLPIILNGSTFTADTTGATSGLATKGRLYKSLDSLKATLQPSFTAQAAKTFFRGPYSGAAAPPSWGLIDSTDLPPIPSRYLVGPISAPGDGNTVHISTLDGDTVINMYSGGILRYRLTNNGLGEWYFRSGSEVGSFRFGTPSNLPGMQLFNASGTGRTQARMLGSSGGWAFGSTTGSGIPTDHFTLTTAGKATFTNDVEAASFTFTPTGSVGTLADGQIKKGADGEYYAGKGGANHKFITADASNNVYIEGRLGVGTNAPQQKFAVATSGANTLEFGYSATYNMNVIESIDRATNTGKDFGLYSPNATAIRFHTNTFERMRVGGDGKVGIGTNNPFSMLHVAGSVQIEDSLTVKTLTPNRVVVSNGTKGLASGPLMGYAQAAINTTQTITITSGALEQIVFLGGTTTSVAFPAPQDQLKLRVRNTTSSPISITSNQPLNDAVTMTSIPANTFYEFVKDGSSWRRLD